MVQKVTLPGLSCKLSLGQALPLVKVPKCIHESGYNQRCECKVCLSAAGAISIYAIHHAGPGNRHTRSRDTYYRLMPLNTPQLFHFVLTRPFCLVYMFFFCLFVSFGSCNLLTLCCILIWLDYLLCCLHSCSYLLDLDSRYLCTYISFILHYIALHQQNS